MSSADTLQKRRDDTLQKLRNKAQQMSEHMRTLPTIRVGSTDLLSYNDAIREVSNNTDTGRKLVDIISPAQ